MRRKSKSNIRKQPVYYGGAIATEYSDFVIFIH